MTMVESVRLILFPVALGLMGILNSPLQVEGYTAPPAGCQPQFSFEGTDGYCFLGTYKDGSEYDDGDWCCQCPSGQFNDDKASGTRSFTRASSCKSCVIGKFQPNKGTTECKRCPLGRVSGTGETSCTKCPPGKYQDEHYKSSCKDCPSGYAERYDGSTACDKCSPGYFAVKRNNQGATKCHRCPRGEYGDGAAQSSCKDCPVGYYAGRRGWSSCRKCGKGWYQPNIGQTWCPGCPGGYYQDTRGSTECIEADIGHYANPRGKRQIPCPQGRYSAQKGSSDWKCQGGVAAGRYSQQTGLTSKTAGKKCPAGRYGREGATHSNCADLCPPGYVCKAGTAIGNYTDCGGEDVHCPRGSEKPQEVPEGHYATGEVPNQKWAPKCPLGWYCQDSDRFKCPAGRYGDERGLTNENCVGVCDDGYRCPAGSISSREKECAPGGDPLYYCQGGFRYECTDGYTVPRHGSSSIRTGCRPCPPEYTCKGGTRYKKLEWTDNFCKYHPTRDTMYVREVDAETAPLKIGEKLTTRVRVEYDQMYYWISSIVQNGRTLEGGKCEKDVTDDSPVTMHTEKNGKKWKGVPQQSGRLKVGSNSTLRFATCGRYNVQVTVTVIQSDHVVGANESTAIYERCSFPMVVQFVNSPPEKKDSFPPLSVPEEMEVFRGASFDAPVGEPLSRMFTDPDGQEVTFTLAKKDSEGNELDDEEMDHPFTVGACTGQVKVSAPIDLLETDKEQFSFLIKVSDNSPDNPGEIFQEVKVDVIQPNRPPKISEDLPVLSVIEKSAPGTPVVTLRDPKALNITTIVHPAFAVDPDGDTVFTRLASCRSTENYCDAFSLTSGGNLTVKNSRHLSYDRPREIARYVRVEYTDLHADPVETLLELQVHQLREAPEVTSSGFDFDESISEGDIIGQLEAKDNHGENFEFTLKNALNNLGEEDDRVSITYNGTIMAAKSSFNSILCRDSHCGNCTEHDRWIDVTVTAKVVDRTDDMPGPTVSSPTTVRLSVNLVNEVPRLSRPSADLLVKENVDSAAITDLSYFYCDRERNTMFFEFQSGLSDSALFNSFSLGTTGQLDLEQALDYEDAQRVEIPVHVEDTGSPSRKRDDVLIVYIIDVPEPPTLNSSKNDLKVRELTTSEIGKFGSIVVTDPDDFAGSDEPYASPASMYRFRQKSLNGTLHLDEMGNVYLSQDYIPDYESVFSKRSGNAILPLEFTVTDIVNDVSADLTVDVTVIDVPEPPYFDPLEQTFAVSVANSPGETLGSLDATSEDIDDPVDVYLVDKPRNASNGAEAPFNISLAANGRVYLSPESSVELTSGDAGSWYSFVVRAIDSQGLEVNGTHLIEVTNKPEAPVWNAPEEFTTDDENDVVKYTIKEHFEGTFDSFQPDCEDPNDRWVQYQLISPDPLKYDDIFDLKRDTGELSVDSPGLLDYEQLTREGKGKAMLKILCIDSFSKPAAKTGKVEITVENIAEPPRFLQQDEGKPSLSVKEDVPSGYPVVEVKAYDPDFTSRQNLSFSIVNNEATGEVPFAISSPRFEQDDHVSAVNLTVESSLNYLTKNFYDLSIIVEDEVNKTDKLSVEIEVIFVNTPPKFNQPHYWISSSEDVNPEVVLAGVENFPFEDRHLIDSWTFSVTWVDHPGLLEFSSNELYVADGKSLNYEQSWFHEFGIRVEDAGGLTDDVNVTLVVENVNDLLIESAEFSPHNTTGGSKVTLLGKDLGPIWRAASINASITSPGGHMVLESDCSRGKRGDGHWDNEAVYCIVPPGIGSNLKWNVNVDDDSRVAPFTTYFEPPSPSAIEEWPDKALTVGGESFLITGQGFGPKTLPSKGQQTIRNPVSVDYESKSDGAVGLLRALQCVVITDDTEIECKTAEGAGANLRFKVISGDLAFLWRSSSSWLEYSGVSYAVPTIDRVAALSNVLPTTGLPDAFWLEGNNFGPSTKLISGKIKNDWISWMSECERENHTHLICSLPEGLGEKFNFEVTVAGQVSPPSPASEAVSYDKPVLDSVLDIVNRPPTDLNTEGNDLVFLYGENFGPGVGSDNQIAIAVYYGEDLEYTAANCHVIEPHVKVQCLTVPGVGKDHSWISEMGNQTSNKLFDVSNYHPPIVATYSRVNATSIGVNDLETPGHEILRIHGRYFGPPGQEVDKVTYGTGNFTFEALSCDVLGHKVMDCVTAPGAGAGHFWTVRIGGQSSEISTTSYEAPILDHFEGVNGSDPQSLSTIGGERIDIVGENFGPPESSSGFLDSVTFGPGGTKYSAADCKVLSHERVRCITPPGHGQMHSWIMVVAGQRSNISASTTSYAPPVLHGILPDHGPTGFDKTDRTMPILTVDGIHLGANLVQNIPIKLLVDTHGRMERQLEEARVDCGEENLLEVVLRLRQTHPSSWRKMIKAEYGQTCEPVIEQWFDGVTSVDISSDEIQFVEGMPPSQQEVLVTLPTGYGVNRSVVLQVGDTYSLPLTFDYDPPRIEAVSPSIASGDRVNLTIYGSNFCGGRSCADMSTECCGRLYVGDFQVPIDVPAKQFFHDELFIVLPMSQLNKTIEGFPKGTVQLEVLDQPNKTERYQFREPLPEVPTQRGRVRLDNFVTRGGEKFELVNIKEVKAKYKSTPELVSVTIGGKPCTDLRVTSTIREKSTGAEFGNITCLTPPHMGTELPVSVTVEGKEVPRSEVDVHYRGPNFCYSYVYSQAEEGDGDTLLFKDESCKDWLKKIAQKKDRSRPPVPNLPLPDESVKSSEGIATTGGVVTVRGFNFGNETFDVDVGISFPEIKGETKPLHHDHERIDFEVPPGAGGSENTIRHAELRINKGEYLASFTFRYQPPSIHSVSPTLLPTNTTDRDRIFIFGSNFGPPTGDFADPLQYSPHVSVEFDIPVFEDPQKCEVVASNHSFIECKPPTGQGDAVVVRVIVDDQKHEISAVDYKKPVVYSISPSSGPTSGETSDGKPVEITMRGENFGVKGNVKFKGTTYEPVVYTHSIVVFHLPEGYGERAPVSVVASGFTSIDGFSNELIFSFDPPVVEAVYRVDGKSREDCDPIERCTTRQNKTSCILEYPDCFPTSGGVRIEVEGNNFGPNPDDNSAKRLPVVEMLLEGHQDTIREAAKSDNPHTSRFFQLPEGVGADLLVQVGVREGSEGRFSGVNESTLLSYDPPRINRIMPNNPDAVGEPIEFRGANFGTGELGELHIKLGNQTCKNAYIREEHTSISCVMPKTTVGPKRIELNVAQRQKSFPSWLELVVTECKKGWYGLQGEKCLLCEEEEPGAVCPGGERFIDLIYSEEGWWRTNDTTPSDRCHPKRQDREKCPVFLPCSPNRACLGNNTCAKQYAGFRCQECADGYFRIGGLCQSCPDHAWLLAVMLGVGVIGVCIGGYIINSKGIRLAAFTIGIDYFQVLALFARTRVDWPMVMERTLQALSFFNLNLELAAPSCWMSPPPTYEVRWMATMAVPLLAFFLLGVIYVTRYLYKLVVLRSPSKFRHTHVNSVIATAVIIMYVLYIFLARRTLDIFNCAPTDPPDGNLYMAGRTDIICWQSPVHINVLVPLASITLIIYVAAVPIFAIVLLRRNKERVKHDQILRAHGYGHTPLSNPNYSFRRRFQRLYHLFKPGKWYWVMLIFWRKFMIAVTSLMFRSSPIYQLATTLLVIFISFVLQVRNHPYMPSKDFHQVVTHHAEKVKEGDKLHQRIQKTIDDTKARNVKRTHASHGWEAQREKMKDSRGQYLVSERIIGYLTDFNTVEAVLLSCAILVNLFGIMFLSSRFEGESMRYYRGDYETLGVAAMIIVLLSCVYFMFVFGFEMLSTFYPDRALRCVAACSCGGAKVKASASEKGAAVGPSAGNKDLLQQQTTQTGFVSQNNPLAAPAEKDNKGKEEKDTSPERIKELEKELEEARAEINNLKKKDEIATDMSGSSQYTLSKHKRQFQQTPVSTSARNLLKGKE